MKKILLIYGAGAIGRGYIPWVFPPHLYAYYYVETNAALCNLLNAKKKFTTMQTKGGQYHSQEVPISHCYLLNEEKTIIKKADAIITAVGPRNIISIVESLKHTAQPIICCENDSSVPDFIASVTGNANAVFAIPDVITSNTAPPSFLKKDPLSIVTEEGICYIDRKVRHLKGNARYVGTAELEKQWKAKLYLHNTPHCIAAYLGAILLKRYLHEIMVNKRAHSIINGAMHEMKEMLIKKFRIDKNFVNWYAKKELRRFRDPLLYDPISRIAREPFRKLAPSERLIGAAQLCLSCGVIPKHIMTGIIAACHYSNPKDSDANIAYLVNSLTPRDFLKILMQLKPGEALYELLIESWPSHVATLSTLKKNES